MIVNAPQRDDVNGTAASASRDDYLRRREGNLKRGSDGFRSPSLARPMRRDPQQGYRPDPPNAPYAYNPASPPGKPLLGPPRNFAYFRQADIGAPRVGFPDARRTRGKLQPSGSAWGDFGTPPRPVLTPAVNGKDTQPSHTLGRFTPGRTSAAGPRWRRPDIPHIYTR